MYFNSLLVSGIYAPAGMALSLIPLGGMLYAIRRLHRQQPQRNHDIDDLLRNCEYEIELYSFEDVRSIDEIISKHVNDYKIAGVVEIYGTPVFDTQFQPDEKNVFELGNILMSAKELKHIDEHTTAFFFDRHIPHSSALTEIETLQKAMAAESVTGKRLLLCLTKHHAKHEHSEGSPGDAK